MKKELRMGRKALALLLSVIMTLTFAANPVYAANASGQLNAGVVQLGEKYYLAVSYVSGNNSIKAGFFEVLTPDGKEVLLKSPVVSFDFKSGSYLFELEGDIPANAILRMTEDKKNNAAQATGKFAEGFKMPGAADEPLDLIVDLGAGNAGNIRVIEFDLIPGEVGGVFGIAGLLEEHIANPPIAVNLSGGVIKAINGNTYTAVNDISYEEGLTYHFKVMVNLPTGLYDIWVTEQFNDIANFSIPGGEPVMLAKDYKYTEGASLTNIRGIYSRGDLEITKARVIQNSFTAAALSADVYYNIESDNTARAMSFKFDIMYPIDNPDTLVGLHDSSVVPLDWTRTRYNMRAANGIFDARNSSGWATVANPQLVTKADTVYHVKIDLYRDNDTSGWFYDVWVAPEGKTPVMIAERYSRLEDGFAYNNLNKLIIPLSNPDSVSRVSNTLMLYTGQLTAAVAAVNAAQNANEMAAALSSASLGLPLDIYNKLSASDKEAVLQDMIGIFFANDLEIRLAFDKLVREGMEPPDAPKNVAASLSSSNNVLITWDLPANKDEIRYYEVARSDGSVFDPYNCTVIARVEGGVSSTSDAAINEFSTYSYAVRAVSNTFALVSEWSVPSTVTTGADPVMIFDKDLVATAMNVRYDRGFILRRTSATSLWFIKQDMIPRGAPEYAVAEWADSNAIAAGVALRYLASVCAVSPQYEVGGKTVEDRVLEHIRFIIAGGNEWGCSGQGQGAKDYTNHVLALTIIKVQAPGTFAKLTAEEQAKIDLLMEATLIGAHYVSADANFSTSGGGVGPVPKAAWFDRDFGCTTGVDQTFNYDRGWGIGHRAGILTAVSAYYYFGGSLNGGSKNCNDILANFEYEVFMQRLLDAGFINIHTVFSNAGNEAEGSQYPLKIAGNLQVRTRSSANSAAGEYLYYGNPMDKIGEWVAEYVKAGLGGGPIRPYGGDEAKPNLTPLVVPCSNAKNSIMRPFGYPGYLDDIGDDLLNFPNLGAPGMQMLLDTLDAGSDTSDTDYGPDEAARGARSSIGYAAGSITNIQMGFFFLQAFDGLSADGKTVAGIPVDEYADLLAQGIAGLDDFFYKAQIGYHDYHKGYYRGIATRTVTQSDLYQDDIWKNVTDNKADMIRDVKAAGSPEEVRSLIELPLFGLILFQYNGLSDTGKNNVAGAIFNNSGSVVSKKDLQNAIASAVAVEAVREFNELISKPGVQAEDVLDMLSVELRKASGGGYTPSTEPKYNALGIFVYGFTDFYTYNSERGQATRIAVSQYLIDNVPEGGFADRRAIRDAIKEGLEEVNIGPGPDPNPDVIRKVATKQVVLQNITNVDGSNNNPQKYVDTATFLLEQNNNGATARHRRAYMLYDLPAPEELENPPAGYKWSVTADLYSTGVGPTGGTQGIMRVFGIPATWDPNEITYPNQNIILPDSFIDRAGDASSEERFRPINPENLILTTGPITNEGLPGMIRLDVTDYILGLVAKGETVASLIISPDTRIGNLNWQTATPQMHFIGIGGSDESQRPMLTFTLVEDNGSAPASIMTFNTGITEDYQFPLAADENDEDAVIDEINPDISTEDEDSDTDASVEDDDIDSNDAVEDDEIGDDDSM